VNNISIKNSPSRKLSVCVLEKYFFAFITGAAEFSRLLNDCHNTNIKKLNIRFSWRPLTYLVLWSDRLHSVILKWHSFNIFNIGDTDESENLINFRAHPKNNFLTDRFPFCIVIKNYINYEIDSTKSYFDIIVEIYHFMSGGIITNN